MKIYDESMYCQECGDEIRIQEHLFNNRLCDECSSSLEDESTPGITFTPVDSTTRLVEDIRAAGYEAHEEGGGVVSDIPDEEYRALMARRGYVRDEE